MLAFRRIRLEHGLPSSPHSACTTRQSTASTPKLGKGAAYSTVLAGCGRRRGGGHSRAGHGGPGRPPWSRATSTTRGPRWRAARFASAAAGTPSSPHGFSVVTTTVCSVGPSPVLGRVSESRPLYQCLPGKFRTIRWHKSSTVFFHYIRQALVFVRNWHKVVAELQREALAFPTHTLL